MHLSAFFKRCGGWLFNMVQHYTIDITSFNPSEAKRQEHCACSESWFNCHRFESSRVIEATAHNVAVRLMNILVFIVDSNEILDRRQRADVIVGRSFDRLKYQISLVSVPKRTSWIYDPCSGKQKGNYVTIVFYKSQDIR